MNKMTLIDKLLDEVSTFKLLSELNIPQKKVGSKILVLCPHHNDTHPSLQVNEDGKTFHCFACGFHVNIIGYYAELKHITRREAVLELVQKFNIQAESYIHKNFNKEIKEGGLSIAEDIFKKLNNKEKLNAWIEGRGFDHIDAEIFAVENASFSAHIKTLDKQQLLEMYDCGIIYDNYLGDIFSASSPLSSYVPFFPVDSILFPIRDKYGKLISYTARAIPISYNPKYKYLKGFKATNSLYRIDKVWSELNDFKLRSVKSKDGGSSFRLYIVEGFMDALRIESKWCEDDNGRALAVLGSSIKGNTKESESQVGIIKDIALSLGKKTLELIIFLDSDDAGVNGTYATIKALGKLYNDIDLVKSNIEIKCVYTRALKDKGKDPDEILKNPEVAIKDIDSYIVSPSKFYVCNRLTDEPSTTFVVDLLDAFFYGDKYGHSMRYKIMIEMFDAFGLDNVRDSVIIDHLVNGHKGFDDYKYHYKSLKDSANPGVVRCKNTCEGDGEIEDIDKFIEIAKSTYSGADIEFPLDIQAWDRFQKGSDFLSIILKKNFNIRKAYAPYSYIYESRDEDVIPRIKMIPSHQDMLIESYIMYHLFRRGIGWEGRLPFIGYDENSPAQAERIRTYALNEYLPRGKDNVPITVSFAYQVNINCVAADKYSEGLFRKFYDCWQDYISFIEKRIKESPRGKNLAMRRLDVSRYYSSLTYQNATNVLVNSISELQISEDDVLYPLFGKDLDKSLSEWVKYRGFIYDCEGFEKDIEYGLPQGPILSAWIANTALFKLDKLVSDEVENINKKYRKLWGSDDIIAATYARYVDDMVIIAPTISEVNDLQSIIEQELHKLSLTLSLKKLTSVETKSREDILKDLVADRLFNSRYTDIELPSNETIEELNADAYNTLIDRGRILKAFYNTDLYRSSVSDSEIKDSIELFSNKSEETKPKDLINISARIWYLCAGRKKKNPSLKIVDEYLKIADELNAFHRDEMFLDDPTSLNYVFKHVEPFFISLMGLKKFLLQRYDRSLSLDEVSRSYIVSLKKELLEDISNDDILRMWRDEFSELLAKNKHEKKILQYRNNLILSLFLIEKRVSETLGTIYDVNKDQIASLLGNNNSYSSHEILLLLSFWDMDSSIPNKLLKREGDYFFCLNFVVSSLINNFSYNNQDWFKRISFDGIRLLLPHDDLVSEPYLKSRAINIIAKSVNRSKHIEVLGKRKSLIKYLLSGGDDGNDPENIILIPNTGNARYAAVMAIIYRNSRCEVCCISDCENGISDGVKAFKWNKDSKADISLRAIKVGSIWRASNTLEQSYNTLDPLDVENDRECFKKFRDLLDIFYDDRFVEKLSDCTFTYKNFFKTGNDILFLGCTENEKDIVYFARKGTSLPVRISSSGSTYTKIGYTISSLIGVDFVEYEDLLSKISRIPLAKNEEMSDGSYRKTWFFSSLMRNVAFLLQNLRTFSKDTIAEIKTLCDAISSKDQDIDYLVLKMLSFRLYVILLKKNISDADTTRAERLLDIASGIIKKDESWSAFFGDYEHKDYTYRKNADAYFRLSDIIRSKFLKISKISDGEQINAICESYNLKGVLEYFKSIYYDVVNAHFKGDSKELISSLEESISHYIDVNVQNCFIREISDPTVNFLLERTIYSPNEISPLGWYAIFIAILLKFPLYDKKSYEEDLKVIFNFKWYFTETCKQNSNIIDCIKSPNAQIPYETLKESILKIDRGLIRRLNLTVESYKGSSVPYKLIGRDIELYKGRSSVRKDRVLAYSFSTLGKDPTPYKKYNKEDSAEFNVSYTLFNGNLIGVSDVNQLLGDIIYTGEFVNTIEKSLDDKEVFSERDQSCDVGTNGNFVAEGPVLIGPHVVAVPSAAGSNLLTEKVSLKKTTEEPIGTKIVRDFSKIQEEHWKSRIQRLNRGKRIAFFQFDGGESYSHPLKECCTHKHNKKPELHSISYVNSTSDGLSCDSFTETRRQKLIGKAIDACVAFGVDILLLPEYTVRPETVSFIEDKLNSDAERLFVWAGTYRNTFYQRDKMGNFVRDVGGDSLEKSLSAPLRVLCSKKMYSDGHKEEKMFRLKKYPAIAQEEIIYPYSQEIIPICHVFRESIRRDDLISPVDYVFELICSELFITTSPANLGGLIERAKQLIFRFEPNRSKPELDKLTEAFFNDIFKFGKHSAVARFDSEYKENSKYEPRKSILLLPAMTWRALDYHCAGKVNNLAAAIVTVFCNAVRSKMSCGQSCFIGNAFHHAKRYDVYEPLDTPYCGIEPGIYYDSIDIGGPLGDKEEALVIADVDPIFVNEGKPKPQILPRGLRLVAHLPVIEDFPDGFDNTCKVYERELNLIIPKEGGTSFEEINFEASCQKRYKESCMRTCFSNIRKNTEKVKSLIEEIEKLDKDLSGMEKNSSKKTYEYFRDHKKIIEILSEIIPSSQWMKRREEVYKKSNIPYDNKNEHWPFFLDFLYVDYPKKCVMKKIEVPPFGEYDSYMRP